MSKLSVTICQRIAAHRAGCSAERAGLSMEACPLDVPPYIIESWVKGYEYSVVRRTRGQIGEVITLPKVTK